MHAHVLNWDENYGRLYSAEKGARKSMHRKEAVSKIPIRCSHIHNNLYLSKTSFPKVFTFALRHF